MMGEWLRRRRNSLGYGVQSPGDFYFVQHVLREQLPYYGYAALKEMQLKYGACLPHYSEATNRLLFRLANYAHPDTIIEVGAGLSTFAMAMACPTARSIALSSSVVCCEAMHPLLAEYPQVEIKCVDGVPPLDDLFKEIEAVPLLHIAHTPYCREIVDAALAHVVGRTLIVIEGIRDGREKRDWWKSLQVDSQVEVVYDLGNIGLLSFGNSYHKGTYWINLKE